jgi:hypothetical protein
MCLFSVRHGGISDCFDYWYFSMKNNTLFATATALLMTVGASSLANAQEARGINPADIDSRVDLIYKRINLHPSGSTDIWTAKYDYKLNNQWGLNFELPFASKLSVPGFSVSGNGDLFARARWIVPDGAMTYGLSFETVLPIASDDALGTGRYQLNVGALAVKAWSRSFLTAAVIKQTTSLGGDSHRDDFSNTEIRLVPVVILSGGWAITGDIRQTWEHRSNLSWQRVEATLNKQITAQWAGSVSYSRDFGDKKDDGTFSAAVKYFF